MNLAFYTYFYGSNKNPAFLIPKPPSLTYKCYYFTNNMELFEKIKYTYWIGVYHEIQCEDDIIESNMIGKQIKSSPHKYNELKEYSYLCYLDNKIENVSIHFIENMITTYFIEKDYALLLREHPFLRNNVWNEFNESMTHMRYIIQRDKYIHYIQRQISNGLSETTEHHCATGFLIRNMKHEKMGEINDTWYHHILECGIQCQISFFFVKQLFQEWIHSFTENPFIKHI
jgi:hypothetical protein